LAISRSACRMPPHMGVGTNVFEYSPCFDIHTHSPGGRA
jgi:hypothetical protein